MRPKLALWDEEVIDEAGTSLRNNPVEIIWLAPGSF